MVATSERFGARENTVRLIMLAKQFRLGLMFTVSVLFPYLVMLAPPAPGQESRANIVGRVTDSSGAVVPNATVTATNQGTNV